MPRGLPIIQYPKGMAKREMRKVWSAGLKAAEKAMRMKTQKRPWLVDLLGGHGNHWQTQSYQTGGVKAWLQRVDWWYVYDKEMRGTYILLQGVSW